MRKSYHSRSRKLISALFLVAVLSANARPQDPAHPIVSLGSGAGFTPQVTRYDLYVSDTIVNFTGKPGKAYAVNGRIPMPTLEFTEGDTALILVHNTMGKEATIIHWHGLILPPQFDGVAYLNTAPIGPGATREYKFALVQSGTYWYHAHTLQEQSGMYGAFIIRKRDVAPAPEYTVVLSEWTDMPIAGLNRRLHTGNDWAGIQKNKVRPGIVQSYWDAIKQGQVGTKLVNEWKRMTAMDMSDVYFDRALANGAPMVEAPQYKKGEPIHLRLINGGASNYFWISWAGGKMSVVASDGADVEPVEVDRFIFGPGETYDVMVTLPEEGNAYELLATFEDRTRSASVWLGKGNKHPAVPLEPLKYFEGMKMMNGMMRMNGDLRTDGEPMGMQRMDMNMVMYPEMDTTAKAAPMGGMNMPMGDMPGMGGKEAMVTLNYAMLRAPSRTELAPAPTKEMRFELTGSMARYVWSMDNRTVSEADVILIHKGENVRFILHNNTMMRHPMHLHGHYFRLLNGQGDHAPLKNTLDIMPMETDTIEFAATESGDWFFHCHILYHMAGGMGRVVRYENSPPNPQFPNPAAAWRSFAKGDKPWYLFLQDDIASNSNDGEANYQNKRWSAQAEWRLGYTEIKGQEVEARLGRYLGKMQWAYPYVGMDWRERTRSGTASREETFFGQANTSDGRTVATFGVQYTLPLLFILDPRIDTDGEFRLQLRRDNIPLSPRLRMDLSANSDLEYFGRLRYILSKTFAASTHYDSDMGFGAGITVTY